MKRSQNFFNFYLTIFLFINYYSCFSQVTEYDAEDNIYDVEINQGNLHRVRGNVKVFTTKLYTYDYSSKKYKESSVRYPEGYKPSKYTLDEKGNIIERIFLGTYADYYKVTKRYQVNTKKINLCHEYFQIDKEEKAKTEVEFRWDYYSDKKITLSLFDKYGLMYQRNKTNLDIYFIENSSKYIFNEKGDVYNGNNLVSKELRYKVKYNTSGKVEKFENFNGIRRSHNYSYDENGNLIREDIYHYHNDEFYEFEMKTFVLNDKYDIIKKNIYKAYVEENPFDEKTMLNKFLSLINNDNRQSKLKYNYDDLEYEYEYDIHDNWTTKFYQSKSMKIVRKLEYSEKK